MKGIHCLADDVDLRGFQALDGWHTLGCHISKLLSLSVNLCSDRDVNKASDEKNQPMSGMRE